MTYYRIIAIYYKIAHNIVAYRYYVFSYSQKICEKK